MHVGVLLAGLGRVGRVLLSISIDPLEAGEAVADLWQVIHLINWFAGCREYQLIVGVLVWVCASACVDMCDKCE